MCRTKAPPACTASCQVREKKCGLQTEQNSACIRRLCSRRKRYPFGSRFRPAHHRVLYDGSVLSVVNALRCASTRPTAGPSGIDDASARHVFGNYAMVGDLSISRRGLTRESRRRMLTSSRQCRTALPPFAATANGARIRPAPTGHGIERNSKLRRLMHDDRKWFVNASIELRTSMPLAAHHPQDHGAAQRLRSPAASPLPWLD